MAREFAVFSLNNAVFALDVGCVREVLRAATLSAAPDAPALEGLLNLRGAVIPVIDIRQLLGLPPQPLAATDLLIVAKCDDEQIALRTEHNVRLETIDEAAIEMTDADVLICGTLQLDQQIVSLLNAKALLNSRQSGRSHQAT